jgi:hypothetical protein
VGREFVLGFIENRVLATYPVIRVHVTSLADGPIQVDVAAPLLEPDEVTSYVLPPGGTVTHAFPYDLHMQGDGSDIKGMMPDLKCIAMPMAMTYIISIRKL